MFVIRLYKVFEKCRIYAYHEGIIGIYWYLLYIKKFVNPETVRRGNKLIFIRILFVVKICNFKRSDFLFPRFG